MDTRIGLTTFSPVSSNKTRLVIEKTPGRKYQRKTDVIPQRTIVDSDKSKKVASSSSTPSKGEVKSAVSLIQLQESLKQDINESLNEINHTAMIKETRSRLMEVIKLEEQAKKQEESSNPIRSLELWEKRLNILRDLYGNQDPKVEEALKKFVLLCNSFSMNYRNSPDEGLVILQIAMNHLAGDIEFDNKKKITSMTLNNISFAFRTKNRFEEALEYAQNAFKIEAELPPSQSQIGLADSYLNVGAILSKLGKHKQSLAHANTALDILLSEQSNLVDEDESSSKNLSHDALYSSIVVAHNNIAVELEHLSEVSN